MPSALFPPEVVLKSLTKQMSDHQHEWSNSRLAWYYYYRAEVRSSTGVEKFADSIKDYDEAIRLNRSLADAYWGRASAYVSNDPEVQQRSKDLEAVEADIENSILTTAMTRAFGDLTEAIRLEPDQARYYRDRAKVASFMKAYQKTVDDTTEALSLQPDVLEQFRTAAWPYSE